ISPPFLLSLLNIFLVATLLPSLLRGEARAETNPIQRENALPGTSEWQLTNPALHREIEGYASFTSVNRGQQIGFYVHTQERSYRLAIYRMGWYGGAGARLVHGPVDLRGTSQSMPSMDPQTGLVECTWRDPYLLDVGKGTEEDEWVSGIYLVKLTASTSG